MGNAKSGCFSRRAKKSDDINLSLIFMVELGTKNAKNSVGSSPES
jgi:hypothetical protein